MKLKIKCIQNPLWIQSVWSVSFNGKTEEFNNPEAAVRWGVKQSKRFYKECAAYSMVCTTAVNLLSIKDSEFIQKLLQSKCVGITKPQYGYIKGIHERQEREW